MNFNYFNDWFIYLQPRWKFISMMTSISDVSEFARMVSKSQIHPSLLQTLNPTEMLIKFKGIIPFQDICAMYILINSQIDSNLTLYESQSPMHHPVSDSDFIERALLSEKQDGCVNILETLLSSSGPDETIGMEMSIHSLLTIPESILISTSLTELSTLAVIATESNLNFNHSVFIARHVISSFYTFTTMFAFTVSILNIAVCSFAKLTDRSTAHYLTLPFIIRFVDLIIMFFNTIFTLPISIFLAHLETNKISGYNPIWIVLTYGIIYIIFCMVYCPILSFRGRLSFDHSPNRRMIGGCYSGIISKILMINNDRESDIIKFIGRWRKRELSKRFRESILDSIAGGIKWLRE